MGQRTEIFDLGRLSLSSGEGRRLALRGAGGGLRVRRSALRGPRRRAWTPLLDVAHTTSGYSLRLRFEAGLRGPVHALSRARRARPVAVDAREVDQPGDVEELRSPYLEGDELDVAAWARDALALALPTQIVCPRDCLGLCPVCGENLNTAAPAHAHERAARSALGRAARAPARVSRRSTGAPLDCLAPWPSPSRDSPTRGPTSAGRSTRSRRRTFATARAATSRAFRIAYARTAVPTPGVRSSCSVPDPATTTPRP